MFRFGSPSGFEFGNATFQYPAALQEALSLTLHTGAFRCFIRQIHQAGGFAELGIFIRLQQLGGVPEQFGNEVFGVLIELFQAAAGKAPAKIGGQIG